MGGGEGGDAHLRLNDGRTSNREPKERPSSYIVRTKKCSIKIENCLYSKERDSDKRDLNMGGFVVIKRDTIKKILLKF